VNYARGIVFASTDEANKTIDTIRHIHGAVEQSRGAAIPDWAYRDVLFMLVHYSIASYELFETELSDEEKEEVYNVFYRLGARMGLKGLPLTYTEWLLVREVHLTQDLQASNYTADLFKQYKKHLGAMRFRVLIEGQKLVVPQRVKELLHFSDFSLLTPVLPVYKVAKLMKMDWMLKNLLLPSEYKEEIRGLDVETN
jgi:hypothetical protein